MTRNNDHRSDELRNRAETLLGELPVSMFESTHASLREVLSELHVHQIELEIQNEELQQAQKALDRSRSSYMHLYHKAPVGYIVLDPAGIIRKINNTFADMVGCGNNEISGKAFADFLVEDDKAIFRARLKAFYKSPDDKQIDVRIRGAEKEMFVSLKALTSDRHELEAAGRSEELLVTVTDVSERKDYEAALEKHRQQLDDILNSISDGFISLDRRLRVHYFNATAENLLGRKRGEVLGEKFFEVFSAARATALEENCRTGLIRREVIHFETSFSNGTTAEWYEFSIFPFKDGLSVYFRVITERKLAEKAIRESERRFKSYIEHAPYAILVADREGRYLQVNPAACRITGYSEEELLRLRIADLLPDEFKQEGLDHFRAVQESGVAQAELRLRRSDGLNRWIFVSAVAVTKNRYMGFIEDVTERKRIQDELFDSQRALTLNHGIARIFLTSDENHLFDDVLHLLLDTFASTLGYFGYINSDGDLVSPTLTRQTWDQCQVADKDVVFPRHCWTGLWGRSLIEQKAMLANGGLQGPPGHLELKNALAAPIIHHGQLIGQFVLANKQEPYTRQDLQLLESAANQTAPILQVFLDKVQRQQLQEKLRSLDRQLSKSESLGRMAGAIAHHHNNILQIIMGNLQLALDEYPKKDVSIEDFLLSALTASDRLSVIGSMMLTYIGQTDKRLLPLNLAMLVDTLLQKRRKTRSELVKLKVKIPGEGPVVASNAELIEPLLDNLYNNALEALEGKEGLIEIEVSTVAADSISVVNRFPLDWQPSHPSYACMTITDSGCGISGSSIENLFDPFYSDKFTGRGMGLSIVLGIVRMHNGAVGVVSRPGKGSAFQVFLPIEPKNGSEF